MTGSGSKKPFMCSKAKTSCSKLPIPLLLIPVDRATNRPPSRSMRSLVFEGNTWEAYEAMREKDKRLHKTLCKLLKEMLRSDDPSAGLGKPEPLKHNLSGLWSKRISQKDRLIYRFDDKSIYIFAIGGHYDQP